MTGRFMINGESFKPRWGNASLAAVYAFPKMVLDEMVFSSARRCIYLTKKPGPKYNPYVEQQQQQQHHKYYGVIGDARGQSKTSEVDNIDAEKQHKKLFNELAMVSSRNVPIDITLEMISKDFSVFGQILTVCPLLLQRVNFSIQFADTRHAIRAKKAFERNSHPELTAKYSGWIVGYGKDPTDRKVPVTL